MKKRTVPILRFTTPPAPSPSVTRCVLKDFQSSLLHDERTHLFVSNCTGIAPLCTEPVLPSLAQDG